MRKVISKLRTFWKDESAQGATEYILLIVIVVGIAMLFKDRIRGVIEDKLGQISSDIGGFSSDN